MFDALIHQMVQQLVIHLYHQLVSEKKLQNIGGYHNTVLNLVNLDRGRSEIENDIRKLLSDIRERRARLVHENSQPPTYALTSMNTSAAIS